MTARPLRWLAAAALVTASIAAQAQAAKAPDALIKEVSTDVLDAVKNDKTVKSGDLTKVTAFVDQKVMPYVDFERMTASAVGRYWRQATPDQQKRLEAEFKKLLIRTYAGALTQVSSEQEVVMKPMRSSPADSDIVVRTEIRGKGDPIQLDYRLEKSGASWKIYDVNVLGVWLGENYRNSFAQEIGANGIDGLINKIAAKNKSAGNGWSRMLLLPATLTSREASATVRMLRQALQSEGGSAAVVVDAGPLKQLDSAALAVLVEVERLARAAGRPFSVRSVPPKLAALAKLYGIDGVLFGEPVAAPSAAQRSPAT